jgi:ribosomal protein S12 methylthiotransferase
MKLYLESLGCARNQVDSEIMTGRLKKAGWTITLDPEEAETIVVNTCSFIEDAAQESIDVILELAEYKKEGNCKRLVVTGCLPERYREEILKSLPEADVLLGTGAFDQIAKAARDPKYSHLCVLPDPDLTPMQTEGVPRDLTVPHVAYLKIAEGCSKSCTYCIIPKLRGKQKSRPPEDIVSEATRLIADGVNELVLVAQDTTSYGNDLPTRTNLSRLMESLANIPIRDRIPDAVLRTTIIVGFPGETDNDFEELLQFVEKVRFDHLGVFVYSDSDDLISHQLSNHIPKSLATDRYHQLMSAQSAIASENNQKYIGKAVKVLVEESLENHLFAGRTNFQAPEVDGLTYINTAKMPFGLKIGCFADMRVTDTMEYDLMGEAI